MAEPLEPDEIEAEASGMAHGKTVAGELVREGLRKRAYVLARGEAWEPITGDIETVLEALNVDAVVAQNAEGYASVAHDLSHALSREGDVARVAANGGKPRVSERRGGAGSRPRCRLRGRRAPSTSPVGRDGR